ncbi:Phosphoadenosine phosphosulfate reductase [Kordia antarctica]|uniref:Phosphoadenosine phosphosulfate reductase n=1 Tax=Kordia antarctica TaxID=1218801 RepID=A0A7L4ZPB5_9FLAO|nr:phosphoadenosine phosphosulfate reductase family protein [Kordia antarctica]QHI38341.1 Phosphoadenosine phosphosulfate reductase [Kordia antarctica]
MQIDIQKINKELQDKTPSEIISWALQQGEKAVVTTNFRPYEGVILHACTRVKPNIDIIWCDTGYNTPNTYEHAEILTKQLSLNIDLYVPKQTAAHRDIVLGIPDVTDEKHQLFTQQVKLEPFKRAMEFHAPKIWFTNLRKGQTAFRDSIDIVSKGQNGVLKVSPFYHWSDAELDDYLETYKIPNEFNYFDPTKVLENRECGLHS